MKPVIYVVVNKSLNMSPGKLAAQVGHAVAMSMMLPSLDKVIAGDHQQSWATAHHKWLIVLEATDTVHLANIERYLDDRNVHAQIIIDEGVNEVPPFSATALGVQILDKDSPEAALFSDLKKYKHPEPPAPITQVHDNWLKRRGRQMKRSSLMAREAHKSVSDVYGKYEL